MSSFMVPPGVRFLPTDVELLRDYLYNKVTGQALPAEGVVFECDLYGNENPWDIWKRYDQNVVKSSQGEDLYFFTRLKRKNPKAKRVERKVGIGSWQGEAIEKEIKFDGNDQCIGFMKRFRFEKSQTNHDGEWIMHEYSLNPSLFPHHFQITNYVICRIRKNERIVKMQNKRKEIELEDANLYFELDQSKSKRLRNDTAPDNEQNGIEIEKENVNMQKDTGVENIHSVHSSETRDSFSPNNEQFHQFGEDESEKTPSIICVEEGFLNEQNNNFSQLQFDEENQKGIEAEKKKEDSYPLLDDENIFNMPISTMRDDQELFFEEGTYEFKENFHFWVDSFLQDFLAETEIIIIHTL